MLATPLPTLAELPAADAKHKIELALKAVFVSSEQVRTILRELYSLCRSYHSQRYPDEIGFLRQVYASEAEHAKFEPQYRVTCFTGLSGVGKTAVIAAFERLLRPVTVSITGHSDFTLRPSWRMTIKSGSGLLQLVSEQFRDRASPRKLPFSIIQRELCSQGVASLHADELQFLTQGKGNALPARLLNQLARLGPPLVFVANYSLIHRLNSRPQEEKQRLLTKPIFMHPDAEDSEDWRSFIAGLLVTAPEFSKLDLVTAARRLHSYSFGLRRLVVVLLTEAYASMRHKKSHFVELGDLDDAYESSAYSSSREVVNVLTVGLEKSARGGSDLWCPLESSIPTGRKSKVVEHPAKKEHARRLGEAALVSSLTPEERSEAGLIEQGGRKRRRAPGKSRPKATAQALLQGSGALEAETARKE